MTPWLVCLYDGAYQLTKTTRTGGEAYTNAFYYDSAGNRTKRVLDAATTTYLYDYIDRMTKAGAGPMQWDEWGSMTSYYAHTCQWDDSDRMTKFDRSGSSSSDADYYYLPGSWKRYKRTLGGTTEYYVYDGDNVLASYASNGTLNASYLTPGCVKAPNGNNTEGCCEMRSEGKYGRWMNNCQDAVENALKECCLVPEIPKCVADCWYDFWVLGKGMKQ